MSCSDLEVLNKSIEEAKESMSHFKEQFEQLRVRLAHPMFTKLIFFNTLLACPSTDELIG